MTKAELFKGVLGSDEFPVEAGRYRFIWTEVCPWSHRVAIVRHLMGLTDSISEGKLNPVITEKGWEFSLDEGNHDPILGTRYMMESYLKTDPNYPGRATVPVIIDLTTQKIVNNESHDLMRQLALNFKEVAKADAPELYPEHLCQDIDALNAVVLDEVIGSINRMGAADTQDVYETNYHTLFNRLDELDARVADQDFLFGDQLTEADIRLFVALVRFDIAYYSLNLANRNRLIDFKNLWPYAKRLYQIPAFRETTNFEAIRKGFWLNHRKDNAKPIIPLGPDTSVWEAD